MGVLYAADLNSRIANPAAVHQVTVGPVTLRKMRVRTLGEIRRTLADATDDPLGFLQLIPVGVPYDPEQLTFDIYQDEKSGMNLAIPSNIQLQENGDQLNGQSPSGNIEWVIAPSQVASDMAASQASIDFEQQIIDRDHSVQWRVDPAWSYPQLRPTPDGMLIMRKSAFGYVFNPRIGLVPSKYWFETFAKRGDYLLSAAVIRTGGIGPGTMPQNDPMWASAILGIHLSSFSR